MMLVTMIPVVPEGRSCSVSTTSSPLYISGQTQSGDGASRRCGTKDHPWTLEAQVGQRIDVSLVDFTASTTSEPRPRRDGDCRVKYGYIVDKAARRNVSICGDGPVRDRAVYVSQSSSVYLVLAETGPRDTNEEQSTFIVRFSGIRCSII